MNYITFIPEIIEGKCIYKIVNNRPDEIGYLKKIQVGQWQSWCLFLHPDCYASAGCLDEIRNKIKELNNIKIGIG
jgi:hypothetical protein